MWNQELISVDPGGGSGGIDYPEASPTLVSSFSASVHSFLEGRRIELARHQFIPLDLPEQLGAHVPEVGHVSTSHGIMKEGPTFILACDFPPPAAWC